MAAAPTRRSPFASHRGAMVKRLMIGGVALAILFMIVSNSLSGEDAGGPAGASASAVASASGSSAVQAPDVAPAVADPVNPYRGVNAGAESSGTPQAPVDPVAYQAMLRAAQQAAVAFGTYDYRTEPSAWAKGLPNLHPELRERLEASAEKTWPTLRQQKVVASTVLTGQNPQVVYYRDRAGEAQVVVLTTQKFTGGSGQSDVGKSYAVTLRYDKSAEGWLVTGLVGG